MDATPFTRIPGFNSLFIDFLYNFEKVARFYPNPQELSDHPIEHRQPLCDILQHQNEAISNPASSGLLQKFRKNDCRCVITGQQIGLFCSPLYTIWKALSAINLSHRFEQEGIPCVPVFWMATEDHNLNEITSFGLLKQNPELMKFSLKEHLFLKRQPTGTVKTDNEEIRKILIRAFQEIKLPAIREFYSASTLSQAFARTLL